MCNRPKDETVKAAPAEGLSFHLYLPAGRPPHEAPGAEIHLDGLRREQLADVLRLVAVHMSRRSPADGEQVSPPPPASTEGTRGPAT